LVSSRAQPWIWMTWLVVPFSDLFFIGLYFM
jgi:hypothetical protein